MRAAVANVGSSLGHLVGDKMSPAMGTALQTGLQTIAAGGSFKSALANIGYASGIDIGFKVAEVTKNPILGAIAGLGTFVASYALGKDDKQTERELFGGRRAQEEAYQKALTSGTIDLFSVDKDFRQEIRRTSGDREDRLGFLKQEDFGSEEWKAMLKVVRQLGVDSFEEWRAQNPLFGGGREGRGSLGPGGRRGHIPGTTTGSIEDDAYNELMAWEPGVQRESRGFGDRPDLRPSGKDDRRLRQHSTIRPTPT